MVRVASVCSQCSVENCVTIGASLEVTHSLTKWHSAASLFLYTAHPWMVVLSSLRNAQLWLGKGVKEHKKCHQSFANTYSETFLSPSWQMLWIDAATAHPKQTAKITNIFQNCKKWHTRLFNQISAKWKHQFIFHPYPIRAALSATIFNRLTKTTLVWCWSKKATAGEKTSK